MLDNGEMMWYACISLQKEIDMNSQSFDTWFDTYFNEARRHQIDAEYTVSEYEAEQIYRPMDQEDIDQADMIEATQ